MFKEKNAVGQRLKEIRISRGITGQELARLLKYNQSGISRIESGAFKPSREYVEEFCKQLKLTEHERADLLELTQAFLFEYDRWFWSDESRKGELQDAIRTRESRATEKREFEWRVISGLLQTEEYANSIIRLAGGIDSEKAISQAVRGRLKRQKILDDPTKRLWIIMAEGALYTPILPLPGMIRQLNRLSELIGNCIAEIRILPFGRQWTSFPSDSFSIYDNHVVQISSTTTVFSLYERNDLELYQGEFTRLLSISAGGQRAKDIIHQAIEIQTKRADFM